MAVHHFAQAAQVNPVLANAFRAIRAADQKAPPGVLYASADDLLRRVELPEFHALMKFIVASVARHGAGRERQRMAARTAWA